MNFIITFTILYGLIPLFFYHTVKNKLKNIRAIYPFIIVVFIASLYEFIGTEILKINASYWFFAYSLISFYSIIYFYRQILDNKFKSLFRTIHFLFLLLLIVLFFVKKMLIIGLFPIFDAYITVVVIVLSVLWFKKIFQQLNYKTLWANHIFYYVFGLIMYHCGTIFLFLLMEMIYNDNKGMLQYYWLLNVALNLILRTLLILGIWKAQVK